MKYFVVALALVASAAVMVRPAQAQSDDFLMKAMEANYAQVQLGHLAQFKAENRQVKDFANLMVQDHGQALEKIQTMIGSTSGMSDVTPDTATNNKDNAEICGSSVSDSNHDSDSQNQQMSGHMRLSPDDQQLCQKLSQLSGSEFDKAYINAMVDDHKQDVRLYEQEAGESGTGSSASELNREKPDPSNASNEAKDFARESLPTLKKHLEAAENLQRQLQ